MKIDTPITQFATKDYVSLDIRQPLHKHLPELRIRHVDDNYNEEEYFCVIKKASESFCNDVINGLKNFDKYLSPFDVYAYIEKEFPKESCGRIDKFIDLPLEWVVNHLEDYGYHEAERYSVDYAIMETHIIMMVNPIIDATICLTIIAENNPLMKFKSVIYARWHKADYKSTMVQK